MFCKVPFRVLGLVTKQMVSQNKKQDDEQNGEQGTAQKEGKQHADCDPKQNKPDYFSHENPSKPLNQYRICGIFTSVRGFFEK